MWCVVSVWWFFILGLFASSQAASLRCYSGSLDNYLVTPLSDPLPLNNCLDHSLPTVVYTFGYGGTVTGPATIGVLSAYLARGGNNVVLLDWEAEARKGCLGLHLRYLFNAVPDAQRIGNELGDALMKLSQVGLNTSRVHLVGLSLGAHLMGHAGRRARMHGTTVARITGLDPTKKLYEGPLAIQPGLDHTCANFVDIIHTDPGKYGTTRPSGTVDFWPNYAAEMTIQPGCPRGIYVMLSPEDLCNLDRSWHFFVESIISPNAFPATRLFPYGNWLNYGTCVDQNEVVYMGEGTSTLARGSFYLKTNADAPFGRGDHQFVCPKKQVEQTAQTMQSSSFSDLISDEQQ